MSASHAHKLPQTSVPARRSPAACPFCKGNGVIHYRQLDPETGRVAYQGTEPCEGCDGTAWPSLVYGGLGPVVCEPSGRRSQHAPVYQLHAPRFALGHLVATPGALSLARQHGVDVFALLCRHRAGAWGSVCPEDAHLNELALKHGARILSAHHTTGGPLWILTEGDRSATTVLLPDEY